MTKTFNFLAILFAIFISNAQTSKDITIAGFTPEVEQMLIKGDMVSYFVLKNSASKNANVQITSTKGNRKFFGSFDIKPDENGHYSFEEQITLKEGPSVTFEGELELLVWIETIFGNEIWTVVKRTKETLSDPIILDHYTSQQGSMEHAKNQFEFNFDCIGYNDELKAKVKANGDSWTGRKIRDFHFLVKNKGDENWKINLYCTKGSVNNKKQAYVRHVNDNLIDFTQPIIFRAETRTLNGNMLWHEEEIEARSLNKRFFASEYTKLEKGEWENIKNNTPPPPSPVVEQEEEEEVEEELIEEIQEIEEIEEIEITEEVIETVIDEKPIEKTTEGAIDLTTKTTSAKCAKMSAGDTLVMLNGTNVCLQSLKPAGSRAKIGTLSMDCNFEVGGNVFPLQGGRPVKFKTTDGTLINGTLRADTKVKTSIGEFTLKSGTEVLFNGDFFTGGKLAENAIIEINGTDREITANPILDRDIRFDGLGRFVEATLVHEMKFMSLVEFTFPPMSRIVYKAGTLNKVYAPTHTSFELNGKTIHVNGSPDPAAFEFDKNQRLSSVMSFTNNIVNVNGQDVKVKVGSEIHFVELMNTYEVEKFYCAEEVTLMIKKGNKEKEVTFKEGKKIVLDENNR